MKIQALIAAMFVSFAGTVSTWAVDYSVAALNEPPPKDDVSAEVAAELAASGFRVTRGSSTAYCDVWLCKSLTVASGFKPTSELLYPFTPGQLIGVAKFARKGADFRDQDIEAGTYTLRYAQQPVDGAHVGTSPTRDFFLLSNAAKDRSPAPLDYKKLTKQSADAAGSSHPAMLCLQAAPSDAAESPSIQHNEEREWWIVTVRAPVKADQATRSLPIAIVVVGQAPE